MHGHAVQEVCPPFLEDRTPVILNLVACFFQRGVVLIVFKAGQTRGKQKHEQTGQRENSHEDSFLKAEEPEP